MEMLLLVFVCVFQIKDECLTCRNGVAVFNMSYFGKFFLTGPDAKNAADWLFTADVNKAPGKLKSSESTHTCGKARTGMLRHTHTHTHTHTNTCV